MNIDFIQEFLNVCINDDACNAKSFAGKWMDENDVEDIFYKNEYLEFFMKDGTIYQCKIEVNNFREQQ